MQLSPLKDMLLRAVLWLPLSFFLWFALSSFLVFPVGELVEWVMTGMFPDLIQGVRQFGYIFEVQTLLRPENIPTGGHTGIPVLVLQINPMVYAYGLPLLAGLVMATPLSAGRRVLQILSGFLILMPVQVWGSCWTILKTVGFGLGEQGLHAIQSAGLSLNVIALCYQFGYLIFPAVTPVVIWVLWNRRFLETLVRSEPNDGD